LASLPHPFGKNFLAGFTLQQALHEHGQGKKRGTKKARDFFADGFRCFFFFFWTKNHTVKHMITAHFAVPNIHNHDDAVACRPVP
jgi:hypothetical protein